MPTSNAAKKTAGAKLKRKPAVPEAGKQKVLSARQFLLSLKALQSTAEKKKIERYFKTEEGEYGAGDQFIGVKMGSLFALAKEFEGMPVAEIEKLLESPVHEARAGAVSIMDKESRT